jgi:hypothetical protein
VRILALALPALLLVTPLASAQAGWLVSHDHGNSYVAQTDGLVILQEGGYTRDRVRVVPGLSGEGISFESLAYPGHFFRHEGYRLKLHPLQDSPLFRQDATFRLVGGLADPRRHSFESINFPGHFVRHRNGELWIDPQDGTSQYGRSATWWLTNERGEAQAMAPSPSGGTAAVASVRFTNRHTHQPLVQDEAWSVEATGDGFVRLRAAGGGYLFVANGEMLRGPIDRASTSAMWALEEVEGAIVKVRHRATGHYVHMERGVYEVGPIEPGWWSAMWVTERTAATAGTGGQGGAGGSGGASPRNDATHRGEAPQRWVAWVQTGSRSGAGTDATIKLYVRGTRGEFGPFTLDTPNHDDFEAGSLKSYPLGNVELGEVSAIVLENAGGGVGPGWYVEWACVGREDLNPCKDNRDDWAVIERWLESATQTMWTRPRNAR